MWKPKQKRHLGCRQLGSCGGQSFVKNARVRGTGHSRALRPRVPEQEAGHLSQQASLSRGSPPPELSLESMREGPGLWASACDAALRPLPPGTGPLLPGGRLTRPLLSRRALGVSVTDYTFEDCQLALAEGQLRLPADTCLLEFARLLRGLG